LNGFRIERTSRAVLFASDLSGEEEPSDVTQLRLMRLPWLSHAIVSPEYNRLGAGNGHSARQMRSPDALLLRVSG
jgi:hypothetical protein